MRFLPLLALLPLLPLAAAADLEWHVQVVPASKYAPVQFQAQLRNVSKGNVAFAAAGDRPAAELILEALGKPAVRKPLPKDAVAYKGPAELEPSAYAWYLAGDLRHAFGRLAPGSYTLRVALDGVVSEPAAFEVIDTSIEEARKAWTAPEGIELSVKAPGVGVLRNRRKTPIGVSAYGGDRKDRPLDALVIAQQWTGRSWTKSPGGFCGTGLVDVTVAPGGEREIAIPALPDGILRLSLPCHVRNGDKAEAIEAVSEPFLVDTFEG